MSGHWMTAGDLFDGYRHGAYDPAGTVSANACRQVLRELCRVAHDAGIAQISTERLADRLGLSLSTVKRALKRLKNEGYILRPVKGTGNRQGSEPRQSVWVLRRLPDRKGRLLPGEDRVRGSLLSYQQSSRFLRLSESLRVQVLQDWHTLNETGLNVTPPAEITPKGKPDELMADYKARKARERLRVVSPNGIQQSVSTAQQSVTTDPHYTRENKLRGADPAPREAQLAHLLQLAGELDSPAIHCPTWHALTATEAG